MHSEVRLILGVAKSQGDPRSAEKGITVIDLMNKGFAFGLDEWIPQIPGLKNDGIWADTQLASGRRLIAGGDSNVVETMNVTVNASTTALLFAALSDLKEFATHARNFWTGSYQIQPPFIHWKAVGAPDAQYALIYNLDMAVEFPDDCASPLADVTLTIEREPYWRAIPPGVSPKLWQIYLNGFTTYTYTDLSLVSGTGHHFLLDSGVSNKFEFTSATPINTVNSRNYVDIDAADIPGDAPALMSIAIIENSVSTFDANRVYVARSTKPRILSEENTGSATDTFMRQVNAIIANRGSTFTDASAVNDTGAVANAATVRQRVNISFATVATDARRIGWTLGDAELSETNWRGKYAIYARARQVNGAAGDILMHLQFNYNTSTVLNYQTGEVSPTISGTTGNTTGWPLTYMGDVTIPVYGDATVSPGGRGLGVENASFSVDFYARRTTGAGVLYVCDLIFMPYDEYSCLALSTEDLINLPGARCLLLDNTSYMHHGKPGDYAGAHSIVTNYDRRALPELRGDIPMLEPGIDNRLYFLFDGDISGNQLSDPNTSYDVRINVIPRWKGVRDV